jgi:hypothetical protein
MRIRNLLLGFVLAMMVLCAGSFKANIATAQNPGCYDFCNASYDWCMTMCGGNQECQQRCVMDYYGCLSMCHER